MAHEYGWSAGPIIRQSAISAAAITHMPYPVYPRESYPIPTITRFVPPCSTDTPKELLIGEEGHCRLRANRFESVIFTDGACRGNGLADATGGCGLVISPDHTVCFRLQDTGPTGETHSPTSNRAELRAENRLIIATDSKYVVLGITERIHAWIRRGWRTNAGPPVKNQDLWKKLIDQVKKLRTIPPRGTVVSFWRIPREWNVADYYAKKGAMLKEAPIYETFTGVHWESKHLWGMEREVVFGNLEDGEQPEEILQYACLPIKVIAYLYAR
ncbi:hypothetical protein DSL72_002772 [Monilinia vaccinii-corymbosi]|uniref:ribonuclease H n=1 Tax=Monilinia vaccinii-corymbosi TaxID=61207 RepID=A0A8A3PDP8_9HELO|nr:hypothetical protein DSL72_002772 [Monilinia vaccinii-corymbosi]